MVPPVVRTVQVTCNETPTPSTVSSWLKTDAENNVATQIKRHSCKYNLFSIGFVWNGKSGKKVILVDQNAHRF